MGISGIRICCRQLTDYAIYPRRLVNGRSTKTDVGRSVIQCRKIHLHRCSLQIRRCRVILCYDIQIIWRFALQSSDGCCKSSISSSYINRPASNGRPTAAVLASLNLSRSWSCASVCHKHIEDLPDFIKLYIQRRLIGGNICYIRRSVLIYGCDIVNDCNREGFGELSLSIARLNSNGISPCRQSSSIVDPQLIA
ncbi:hypothetical protein D3C78_1318960 [compost metagenome]